MSADVQLISDGDGLAVIGDPTAVDLFLAAERLASQDLGLPRLGAVFKTGAQAAQAYTEIAGPVGSLGGADQGVRAPGQAGLMKSSTSGVSTGVVKAGKGNGQTGGLVELAKDSAAQLSKNPAVLSGAAGLMAQLAMQQTMDEITDYLAAIDAKLDDVLRAQEDAVLADMIGVGFDIDEAMTLREHGGRVNEVTWSKVQGSSATIARTQAYALRQLDALAEKLERQTSVGDLAETAKKAEAKTQDWLAVLARCFQLQDAIAVLELDRVLEVAPDDLDGHRLGLKAVRQKRLETISQTTHASAGPHGCGSGHGQREGAAEPAPVAGHRAGEGARRGRRHRLPRAARDRVRWAAVGGGAGLDVRRHGVPGQGAGDRRGGRRRVLAPRERDLRPGQVGDGQALQRDRRARGALAGERRGARAGGARVISTTSASQNLDHVIAVATRYIEQHLGEDPLQWRRSSTTSRRAATPMRPPWRSRAPSWTSNAPT